MLGVLLNLEEERKHPKILHAESFFYLGADGLTSPKLSERVVESRRASLADVHNTRR
uniref:Uncharacterized protein n=1 Tax=viral metagenome TaxID=1070528 RepID=A0A6M3JC14_9ZZZZ